MFTNSRGDGYFRQNSDLPQNGLCTLVTANSSGTSQTHFRLLRSLEFAFIAVAIRYDSLYRTPFVNSATTTLLIPHMV